MSQTFSEISVTFFLTFCFFPSSCLTVILVTSITAMLSK